MRQSPPWMRKKERSTYGSPAPYNVHRYQNPLTGFPYVDRMREDIESARSSGDMPVGRKLAQKGKVYRKVAYEHARGKQDRKDQLLSSLERFRYDNRVERYLPRRDLPPPEDPNPQFIWQPLSPSSPSAPDLNEFDRKRFNRSVRDMKTEHWNSVIMPRGRVGYGDISFFYLTEMRRALREDDPSMFNIDGIKHESPSHWTPRELAFSHRLRGLSSDDLNRYNELQSEYNPDLSCNKAAKNRMTPRPTQYNMYHLGDKRVKQIRATTEDQHQMSRQEIRDYIRTRGTLPSSFNINATPLPFSPISEAEEDPYTFTTYPVDPETNLIPTTRSLQMKLAKLKEEEKKRQQKEEETKSRCWPM